MRPRISALVVCALVAGACTETPVPTSPRSPGAPEALMVKDNPHIHVMLRRPDAAARGAKPGGKSNTGIFYHGGPVLINTKVAAIYWSTSTIYNGGPTPGTTGSGTQDGSLVGFFLRNLGGSPYFNINTTYYDGNNNHVQNSVAYTGFWADNTDPGATVSDAQVQQEVVAALNGGLTYDASTLYVVFSGAGVNLGGGFGSQYCAYHGHFSNAGRDIKYAVMPYTWSDPSGCSALNGSPNGDPAADAEVNVLAHETEETTTDEDLNAWYDRRGYENADKCAWTFGTTYTTTNGSVANMNLGGKDFLVQRNWVNAPNAGCQLAW